MLEQGELGVGRLSDEYRRHGQIDRRPVQVERITGGDHQPDHRFRAAELFHLGHHARQHRFRRGCAEHDQQFLLDVRDEANDGKAGPSRDEAEHDEDEQQAGEVEASHQLGERHQRGDAVFADGERHRAEGADRRRTHDEADDDEKRVRELVDEAHDRLPLLARRGKRQAEQHREEQHLQDLSLRKGVDEGVRDHVHEKVDGALRLGRGRVTRDVLGIDARRIGVEADAGLERVDDEEADDQRERADDLEVEEREAAGLADLLHVLHAGDADDHRAEDDRRDDHLDQLDERVAERLHRFAGLGPEMAEDDPADDREQHLRVEMLVERLFHGVSPGLPAFRCGRTALPAGSGRTSMRSPV